MVGYAGTQGTMRRVRDRMVACVGVGIGALVLLSGCAAGAAPETTADASSAPSVDTSAPAPTPPPTPSAAAAPEGIDTNEWLDFATGDGTIAFRYPADWALEATASGPIPGVGPNGDRVIESVSLTAPNGQELLQMDGFVDIGGACPAEYRRPLEVLAIEPFAEEGSPAGEAVIATIALSTMEDQWRVGVGITASEWVEDDPTCGVYFVFGSSQGGVSMGTHFTVPVIDADPLWDVATLDDARAYMETDEYATILEILRSVEVA